LPEANEDWLAAFSQGFFALADRYEVELVGGDTTRGPLNISITAGGEVPAGKALRRDNAQMGDDIWVSGCLGDAALALAGLNGKIALAHDDAAALAENLHRPLPRIEAGIALRGIANAAIDVSDGLAQDLEHILQRSQCGASVVLTQLPQSPAFARYGSSAIASRCLLAGGDDYELCFTAPAAARESIAALARKLDLPLTRIGQIEAQQGLRVRDAEGKVIALPTAGYDHFK
jgi:thiamine-monophosphate kinase